MNPFSLFANKFLSFSLAIVMVFATIPAMTVLTACNSSQALLEVQRFEPVILNALNLACTIQSTLPICGTMAATIKADADLVIKVWGDYNAAVAAGTSTVAIWNQLNAAFSTFEQDSAAIFAAAAGLNAPTVMAVVAAAQVLLAAIEALFPAPPAGVTMHRPAKFARYGQAGANYNMAWLKSWTKDYNGKIEIAKKQYPKADLHKVYVHSTAARVASLGLAD